MNRMLSTRAEIALAITREAGDLARHWFDKSTLRVDTKSDGSPVTQADQEIEQMIRDALSENFPDDGIMGEEFDDVVGSSGNRWIIDRSTERSRLSTRCRSMRTSSHTKRRVKSHSGRSICQRRCARVSRKGRWMLEKRRARRCLRPDGSRRRVSDGHVARGLEAGYDPRSQLAGRHSPHLG